MDTTIKIGINGFGRIGRTLFRQLIDHTNIEVVEVNDISNIETMSHLLKYDSIHGVFDREMKIDGNSLIISKKNIQFHTEPNIEKIPWGTLDFVVDCTGKYKTRENHLKKRSSSLSGITRTGSMGIISAHCKQWHPGRA